MIVRCEVVDGMPADHYHKNTGGWGHSALKYFHQHGIEQFRARYITGEIQPTPPTPALLFGSAVDELIEAEIRGEEWRWQHIPETAAGPEFASLLDRYAVRPEGIDLRTKEGKAWLASIGDKIPAYERDLIKWYVEEQTEMGARFLPLETYRHVVSCLEPIIDAFDRAGIRSKELVTQRSYINGIYSDQVTLQTRPDFVLDDHLIDLKTTSDIGGWSRRFISYGYWIQAGLFSILHRTAWGHRPRVSFLVVESNTIKPAVRWVNIEPDQLVRFENATILLVQALDDALQVAARPLIQFGSLELKPWHYDEMRPWWA